MIPLSHGLVRSREKLNTYLHLQKTYGHQTRQGGNSPRQTPNLNVIWLFDHMTNMRSCYKLKKLHLHFQIHMLPKLDRVVTLRRFRMQTLKLSPTSCFFVFFFCFWTDWQNVFVQSFCIVALGMFDLLTGHAMWFLDIPHAQINTTCHALSIHASCSKSNFLQNTAMCHIRRTASKYSSINVWASRQADNILNTLHLFKSNFLTHYPL